jgi:hypothetical protein
VNAALARDLLEFVQAECAKSTVVAHKMTAVTFGTMAKKFPNYGFGDVDYGFSRKNVLLLPENKKPLHPCSFIDITKTGGKRK